MNSAVITTAYSNIKIFKSRPQNNEKQFNNSVKLDLKYQTRVLKEVSSQHWYVWHKVYRLPWKRHF